MRYMVDPRPLPGVFVFALFAASIGVIEYLDYVTGPELDLSFLLLFPVFLVVWRFGWRIGMGASVFCAFFTLLVDHANRLLNTNPRIALWNTTALFIFFAVFTWVLEALRRELDFNRVLARTDNLTGLLNRRAFLEELELEILRLGRFHRPFTVLYLDVDNFKWVNDHAGHSSGDRFLKTLSLTLNETLREIDLKARIGGDEFAVLLAETDEIKAQKAVEKLEARLAVFFSGTGWPVSASLGWIVCRKTPKTPEELIDRADRLMYKAKERKKRGKARLRQA